MSPAPRRTDSFAACLLASALVCSSLLLSACEDDDGTVVDASTSDAGRDGAAADAATTDAPPADARADGSSSDAAPAAADLDVVLVRFNADGTRDMTFGSNGIARIDFGPGSSSARDALWGVDIDAMNRLVLFGSKKGADPRNDTDRVVARLTPAGALDTTFGSNGFHVLNIANLGDSARHGMVDPDQKIVSSGYTPQPTGVGTQDANRVVLLRLLDNGMPDMAFGVNGVVNSAPFVPAAMPETTMWGMAEAYGVARQSTGAYVTTGYGRSAATGTVDMVSFRYGADGKRDLTWAGTGVALYDLAGADDRGRNVAAVGDAIVIVGSAKPTATSMDSLVIKLQATGMRDATYGTDGAKLYDFGKAGDEPFYGVAVSADKNWVLATGYSAEAAPTTVDSDATLLLLQVAGGTAEVWKAVPASETESDGFYAAAFDANNKAYGAGYVREGADSLMLVSRFNADGTPDTTFAGGVVKVNVAAGGGAAETARDIVVQPDGKVVIAGVAEVP